MWNCTFNLPEKLQMVKVMPLDTREVIPDLNSPFINCQLNTKEMGVDCVLNGCDTEIPSEDELIDFMEWVRVNRANGVVDTEGAIVPADTENLLSQKHGPQEEIPARDACIGFTAPISRDGDIVPPADTENLLSEKHRHQEEIPSRDACIGFTDPINRGVIVPPADTENLLSEKHGNQEEIPARIACIGFTDPISRGAIVLPADTENLLSEKHGHQEEIPARDACIGFTHPINRVNHANGVGDVAGAIVPPADTENLLSEKHGNQEEIPARIACIGFTDPVSRGAIVPPADAENLLSEKHGHQEEIPARDACIGFTAPISRGAIVPPADTENLLSEKHGPQEEIIARDACIGFTAPINRDSAIVPLADTENLLSEKHGHQEEIPARDACFGFTAPNSRDVDYASGVVEVAGASADNEKLFFKEHVQLWEAAESSEAFRKFPQNPHFLGLKSCKEVLREGQALGRMVIFNTVASKTLNFNLDTKREVIEDNLSLLEELETDGFDGKILKDRMKRLLRLKNEEKFKKMSEQRNRVLSEHVQEYFKFAEIRAKAEERIKELQDEVELAFKMEKDMDAKKASVLEEDSFIMKNAAGSVWRFKKLFLSHCSLYNLITEQICSLIEV